MLRAGAGLGGCQGGCRAMFGVVLVLEMSVVVLGLDSLLCVCDGDLVA
jgi:hypothetical protein